MSASETSIMRQCEGLRRATDTVPPDGRQKRGHYLAYEIFHLPASRSHTPRGPTTVLGPSRVSIQRAGGLDSPSRVPATQSPVKTSSLRPCSISKQELALRVYGGTFVPMLKSMQKTNFLVHSLTALGHGTALSFCIFFAIKYDSSISVRN